MDGSGKKKAIGRIWKKILSNNQLLYWKNKTIGAWKLQCAQFFAKLVLDTIAVCSLVPRINLSHTQQSYLCLKNQNYLLGKVDLRFFLSYGLKTTINTSLFNNIYLTDNVLKFVQKV